MPRAAINELEQVDKQVDGQELFREAVRELLKPDIIWLSGDDLCDCVYQRIGFWTNPYLAQTLEIRLCCVWTEWEKLFPQFFRRIDAYWDINEGEWNTEPRAWDSPEMDMPLFLWYRQEARKQHKSLAEVRRELKVQDRPKRSSDKTAASKIDKAKQRAAVQKRFHATGWLLPGEKLPKDLEDQLVEQS